MADHLTAIDCRMGRAGRLLLTGALLAALGWPALAQDEKLPDAEKMMEMSIKARGGRETFEKFKTCVRKGKLKLERQGQEPIELGVELYEEAPNKYYQAILHEGTAFIQYGSNGRVLWEMRNGVPKILEGEEKEIGTRRARFNSFLCWQEFYSSVECVAKVEIDDHSCYKVLMVPKVGESETMYYDRKTGLPVRMETLTKVSDESDEKKLVATRIEDYRKVGDVMVPFRTVRLIPAENPVATYTTTWESIEYDAKIPMGRLSLPPAVHEEAQVTGQLGQSEDQKE